MGILSNRKSYHARARRSYYRVSAPAPPKATPFGPHLGPLRIQYPFCGTPGAYGTLSRWEPQNRPISGPFGPLLGPLSWTIATDSRDSGPISSILVNPGSPFHHFGHFGHFGISGMSVISCLPGPWIYGPQV